MLLFLVQVLLLIFLYYLFYFYFFLDALELDVCISWILCTFSLCVI